MYSPIVIILLFGLASVYGATDPKAPNFDADFLKAHNDKRALHGCGPLEYDDALNREAQAWADKMAAANYWGHSDTKYGENLYSGWSSNRDFTVSGSKPVESWYAEIADYDFANDKGKPGKVVGHFTQVVWKNSKKLGVGVARTADNWIYVVANYDPPGNYRRQYDANVPDPIRRMMAVPERKITKVL